MKKCELCNSLAKMHCDSDQASLCWDCDAKVHAANFLVAKHSRTLLCHLCQSFTPWKDFIPCTALSVFHHYIINKTEQNPPSILHTHHIQIAQTHASNQIHILKKNQIHCCWIFYKGYEKWTLYEKETHKYKEKPAPEDYIFSLFYCLMAAPSGLVKEGQTWHWKGHVTESAQVNDVPPRWE